MDFVICGRAAVRFSTGSSRTSRGQTLVEHLVLWPALILLTMAAIQLGFLFRGKATLNTATFMAAREGAMNHAFKAPMKTALANAMAPLALKANPNVATYGVAVALSNVENSALPSSLGGADITIISPSKAVFNQFATQQTVLEPCTSNCPGGGKFREARAQIRQIPNDNLSVRSDATANISGGSAAVTMNLQDANLLKIRSHWCFPLQVPIVNVAIHQTLLLLGANPTEMAQCQVKTLAATAGAGWSTYYIPISSMSVVRMQSAVRCEDAQCSNLGSGGVAASAGGGSASGGGASNGGGAAGGNDDDSIPPTDYVEGGNNGPGDPSGGDGSAGSGSNGGVNEGGAGSDPVSCDGGVSGGTTPSTGSAGTPAATPPSLAPANAPTFTGVGNPIDLGTGNKYQRETDYVGTQADTLFFVRSYNSVLTHRDVGLGAGWRYSYQRAVVFDEKNLTATVRRDDGTQYAFSIKGEHGVAPLGVIDKLERSDAGWFYRVGNGDIEQYDKQGRLLRVDYPSGVVHALTYDEAGRLHTIRDSRGDTLTLVWRGQHLHHIELPAQQRIDYAYDDVQNLRSVTRSHGFFDRLIAGFKTPERRYYYENKKFKHALTGLDDATGARYATWAYDGYGRGILSQHGNGAEKITINYRPRGAVNPTDGTRRVAVSNALGLTALYTLEPARAGKYRLKDIDGQPMRGCSQIQAHHRYDERGFVFQQFNADRIGNLYTRDQRGLIETEQRGLRFDDNEQAQITAGATRIERRWDKDHPWLLSETHLTWMQNKNAGGYWQPTLKREFSYDNRGRVLTDTRTDLSEQVIPYATQGANRTRTYRREFTDAEHTQLQTLIVSDANQQDTTYHYANGHLQNIENPLHHITQFNDYNAYGQAESVQLPNGQTLRIHYNEHGLPVTVTRGQGDGRETTQAEYDEVGKLTHLTRPDGSEQIYHYTAAGQLDSIQNGWGERIQLRLNPLNGQWEEEHVLDASGKVARHHRRRFNGLGQLAALIGNDGQQTAFNYDSSGNMIAVSERDQNPAHTDLAHTTQAVYDTQHRLLELIDAAGYSTHYARSTSGAIEAVTDANNNTTQYVRNGFGEIIEQNSPTTGSVIKRYDANGNLIENQSPGGAAIQFHYDALNRLSTVDYPGEQNDIRYIYDQTDNEHGNGVQQLTRIETQTQIIDYRYDAAGRKVQETTTDKNSAGTLINKTTLAYRYLPGNRIDSITYPDGSVVHYRFDKDRITEVAYTAATEPSKAEITVIKDIAYAPFGGPISWLYGNGLKQQQQLDLDGRIQSVAVNNNSEALWSQQYQYDLYQNIAQIHKEQPQEKLTQQFAYDKLDRLTQEVNNKIEQQYTYDALGNRIEAQQKNGQQENNQVKAVFGRGNQLRANGDNLIVQESGNTLIEKSRTDTRFTLYDNRNRPRALYNNKQLIATYGYDVRGWRNTKTAQRDKANAPITERFQYSTEGRLLSEANLNSATKNYVWLGGTPIAQIENDKVNYLHADHLSAPRVATNDKGQITWRWHGDAFGNGAPEEDVDRDGKPTRVNLRFPGQYADVESGLHYNIHRYYDPEKGRYTQSDPLGLADGVNSFAYVQNNPVRGVDPLGLYNAYTHFYMTYFLAVVSGIPEDVALKIALATEYVDENTPTEPTTPQGFANGALGKYHFTLDYGNGNHGDSGADSLTRFYDPSSNQLNRLYAITTEEKLTAMWHETHKPPADAGYCLMPNYVEINNARYQFYGEYLHAYEDTFAHRDMNNLAYAEGSLLDNNTPGATVGHVGLGTLIHGGVEAPDQTYNTEEGAIAQSCTKPAPGPKATAPLTRSDLDAAGCEAWGGSYTPAASWQYNELRTLRMEYQVFKKFQDDFGAEIALNKSNGGKSATWQDLAGTADWDEDAARIGGNPVSNKEFGSAQGADKLQNVLQQFNAAGNADKYDVLNDWLRENQYITGNIPQLAVKANAGEIDEDSKMDGTNLLRDATANRTDALKWIPQNTKVSSGVTSSSGSTTTNADGTKPTNTEFGVILPPNTGAQTQPGGNPFFPGTGNPNFSPNPTAPTNPFSSSSSNTSSASAASPSAALP